MTRTCSAWCRPNEGVHVLLYRQPVDGPTHVDGRRYVGRVSETFTGDNCIPAGATVLVLDHASRPLDGDQLGVAVEALLVQVLA